MARYTDTLRDQFLRPLPGALVSVADIFGNAAVLTDDDDQPLDNPFYTDSYGNYVFNTSDGIYTIGFNYGGRKVFEEVAAVGTLIANLAPDKVNAGKFLALDANGVATYSSGTGADSGLRTDLAASNGAALAGFLQADTGAVAHTVQDKNGLILDVYDSIPKSLWAATRAATSGATFNASPYIQTAIDAAVARGATAVNFRGGQFRCNTAVNWYPEKVSLIGDGAIMDCRGLTGVFLTAVPINADRNLRAGYSTTSVISGFTFWGPSADLATAIKINDTGIGVKNLAGITVENCFFRDFGTDFYIGEGAFWFKAETCTFMTLTAPVPTQYSVNIVSSDNSGERIQFSHCSWANRTKMILCDNGNAGAFFNQCSLVYSDGIYVTANGGMMSFSQCHIEGTSDAAHWFSTFGTDTLIRVDDCIIVSPQPKAACSPFYSDSTATNGGIEVRNTKLVASMAWSVPLVAGTGRAVVDGLVPLRNGTRPILGASTNLLAYPGFESVDWAGEWVITDPAYIARVTSPAPRTGTYSLKIEGTNGGTMQASFTYAAVPGQNFFGELYYQTAALTASAGTFFVQAAFLDKGGNALLGNTVLATTANVGAWTKLGLTLVQPAPAGTVSCRLLMSIFGVTTGSPKAYIDDIVVNLS